MNTTKQYPAKALLFGEYTVLMGSPALAVPVQSLYGSWSYGISIDERLQDWVKNLRQQQIQYIDFDAFELEIGKGLFFQSSIPSGYGAGSSGALTAALFDCFGIGFKNLDPELQRKGLASAESIFHGRSSGIDPLVSYGNRPVLYSNDKGAAWAQIPEQKLSFYLLDSGQSRKTQKLVAQFLHQMESDKHFVETMKELSHLHTLAIEAFQASDTKTLWQCCTSISSYQLKYMPWLFPESIRKLALEGLQKKTYAIKLSGAGGGGYFLLISNQNLTNSGLNLKRVVTIF